MVKKSARGHFGDDIRQSQNDDGNLRKASNLQMFINYFDSETFFCCQSLEKIFVENVFAVLVAKAFAGKFHVWFQTHLAEVGQDIAFDALYQVV